ncbi:MAG: ABC transporter permease [Clostridia bacterium]|nr:ABC transporter permease [Clostridia bacterium]
MLIILKFILKNIKEKKMRTFLIVFSIMISSALFFASSAVTDSLKNMYIEQIKKSYGEAEIVIRAGNDSPSKYFSGTLPAEYEGQIDYKVDVFNGLGVYKHRRDGAKEEVLVINLKGIEWQDIQKMTPVTLAAEYNLEPFKGKKLVLSKKTADKYGIELGEAVDIYIEGVKYKFAVCAIAQMTGPFSDDGQTHQALVPRETLSTLYGQKGSVTDVFIKLKNPIDKGSIISRLSEDLKRYSVKETISESDLQAQTGSISVILSMALVMVLFMSIFIIYSSFKVITTERLPVIGTFRSIGASRMLTDFVLLLESIFYGVTGGSLGCVMGIGVLYIIARATTPVWDSNLKTTITFSAMQMAAAFVIAVVLSVFSSLIPILKVSKIPVKDIVLNKIQTQSKRHGVWSLLSGLVLLAAALFLPPLTSGNIGLPVNSMCILGGVAAVIYLIPHTTKLFVLLFEKIYSFVFGNEGVLAAKNIRSNKNILNNISLLAIGISSLLAINIVSKSSIMEIINYFEHGTKYDVFFSVTQADRAFELSLRSVEGVTAAKGFLNARGVEVKGSGQIIENIEGADKDSFLEYFNILLDGGREETIKKFREIDSDRNIIITGMLKNKLGVNTGDTITLRLPSGDRDYKVLGIWDTMMYGGNYAIVAERFLKIDFGEKYYKYIAIKTNKDPEQLLQHLKDKYAKYGAGGLTTNEVMDMLVKSNAQIFDVLNGFSVLTALIGVIGVFNNLIISFIERKRSFAVMRSVGMSKVQIVKMIFVEAFTGGLIGGVGGVLGGILQINVMYYMMRIIVSSVQMKYSVWTLMGSLMAGVLITLAASVGSAMKSSKLNIIEAIKYE